MSNVQMTRTVNGPLDLTWKAISTMGAVADWHPNVFMAEVLSQHESGIGASRRVEFHSGDSVVESVVEETVEEFTKVEMTESPMLKAAFVTIRVSQRSADTTDVTFSIDYSVKYGPIGWFVDTLMMKRMFRSVFDVALGGLSYHLETGELVTDSVPAPAV